MAPPSRKRLLADRAAARAPPVTETEKRLTALLDGKKQKKKRRTAERKLPPKLADSNASKSFNNNQGSPLQQVPPAVPTSSNIFSIGTLANAPTFRSKPASLNPKKQTNRPKPTASKRPAKEKENSKKTPAMLTSQASVTRQHSFVAPKQSSQPTIKAASHRTLPTSLSSKLTTTTTSLKVVQRPRAPRYTNPWQSEVLKEAAAVPVMNRSQKPPPASECISFKPEKAPPPAASTSMEKDVGIVLEAPKSAGRESEAAKQKPVITGTAHSVENNNNTLQPNAALQSIPRPAEKPDTKRPSSKPAAVTGNFVRQNLRNSAGACRGARNKRTKSKAAALYEQRKKDAVKVRCNESRNRSTMQWDGPPPQTGVDPVDDYLDGVYNTTSKKRGKSAKRSSAEAIPKCSGHQTPCKLLTVKKATTGNKGRQFYCCSMPRGEQCDHFQWADDTREAAEQALMKNSSHSGFIARQVASYMERIKCLTVPELRHLANRHRLDCRGKRQQLLTRLSIWVRDEVAAGSKENDSMEDDAIDEAATLYTKVENNYDAQSDDSDDSSTSSEELEFFGDQAKKRTTAPDLSDSDGESDDTAESIRMAACHPRKKKTIAEVLHDSESDDESDDVDESLDAEKKKEMESATGCPLRSTLRTLFGHSDFRAGQEWTVERCLNKQRTLLVAPTGFGKSLCFSLPAALMDGVCIVVSPLLSLIQDQIRVLPPRLPAATLSGPLSTASMAATLDDIVRGRIKVLFVSPERLTSASFRRLFRTTWNSDTKEYDRRFPAVSLLCVDEAHTLSQWAHNFRPSYLRLRSMMDLIQPQSVLAITATAGPRVVDDICRTLSIQKTIDSAPEDGEVSSIEENCGVRVMKTDRDNIDVCCFVLSTQEERLSKLIKLLAPAQSSKKGRKAETDIQEGCLSTGSVIVYVWRQRDAEAVAENIQAADITGGVVVYHGGMDSGTRQKAQSQFMRGKARVCVATVAFGLGINKADVAGVVHMYLSASPEHYLQEIGRAGRDGRQARAIALVLREEVLVRHSLSYTDLISKSQIRALLSAFGNRIRESLSSLPEDRSVFEPISVALPLQEFVVGCDCKVETIETIASMLEQRDAAEPLLHIEGTFYDRATIAPKRRSLKEMTEKEPVAKAILHCGICVEPPAGEKIDVSQNNSYPTFAGGKKLVGYSFGSYSFSVAQCANCLGTTAEPRHVFAALRRLQSTGEIELVLETSSSGRALNLRLTREGMRLFSADDNDVGLDQLATETLNRFISTISAAADKVLDMDYIVHRVSEASQGKVDDAESEKSESLELFQNLISRYFDAEGRNSTLLSEDSVDVDVFTSKLNTKELSIDARSVLSHLIQLQGAMEGTRLLCIGEPTAHDYTSLAITKFLHGIAPASAPRSLLRNHNLFGRMQSIRFDLLHNAVTSLFEPREA